MEIQWSRQSLIRLHNTHNSSLFVCILKTDAAMSSKIPE